MVSPVVLPPVVLRPRFNRTIHVDQPMMIYPLVVLVYKNMGEGIRNQWEQRVLLEHGVVLQVVEVGVIMIIKGGDQGGHIRIMDRTLLDTGEH